MMGIQWFRALRCALFFLATAMLFLGTSLPAAAQEEYSYEENECWSVDPGGDQICGEAWLEMSIFYTTEHAQIGTFVSTDIYYAAQWLGLSTYAGYDLYLNNAKLYWKSTETQNGSYAAVDWTYTNMPVGVQDVYQLVGTHVASYNGICLDGSGGQGYEGGGGGSSGCNWLSSTQSYVSLYANMPYIDYLSENWGNIGFTNQTITAFGYNLVDPNTCTATVGITGTGDTLSVSDPGCQEDSVNIDYSIGTEATTGAQNLTLSTPAGISNSVSFSNDDPTPSINTNGINPSTWQAGNLSFPVTITGTGFGTNPTVSVSDTNATCTVSGASDPGGTGNAVMNALCSVSKYDLNTSATITVTSGGYGNGFAPAPAGATSAQYTVTINPASGGSLPTPQIFSGANAACSGSGNYTNATVNVLVGQPIAFTACIPSSVNLTTVTSAPTWASNPNPGASNAAVANWTVTVTPVGCVPDGQENPCNYTRVITAFSNATCQAQQPSCSFNTFFIVAQGTYTFTYTYSTNVGPASASVTFVASGPTGVNVALDPSYGNPPFAPVSIWPGTGGTPRMGLGKEGVPPYGIWMSASLTEPTNPLWNGNDYSLSWVQVFTGMTFRELDGDGTWTGHFSGQISPSGQVYGMVLDSIYPYVSSWTFYDDPQSDLEDSEFSEKYATTVYLMWDPAIPYPGDQSCNPARTVNGVPSPSTCWSIPVPLGHVSWGACGDGINALTPELDTSTNWFLNCSSESGPTSFVQDTTYPSWQSTIHGSDPLQWALDNP
jgi:hypothetical protein